MTKRLFAVMLASVVSIYVTSCSWMQGKVEDQEVKELDSKMKPQATDTSFDEALFKLGNMLEAYDIPPTPIQSKNVGNETAASEMPTVIYTMIATAFNKIGREVVFIPYDTQYVIDESTTGGKISRMFPEAVLTGGITGFDKELIEKQRSGDVNTSFPGIQTGASASYKAGMEVSRILLDLNMMDYKTQAYYPGVQASNRIYIRKDMLGWSVSASYMDFEVSLESEVKTKQGMYMALRYLVDLSVIEILGKYFSVPYWKCISGAKPDEKMISRLKDSFDAMDPGVQMVYLKKFLYLNGYRTVDRNSNKLSAQEQSVVMDAMARYGAKTYADLFIGLWDSVPLLESRKRVLNERKALVRQAKYEREQAQEQAQKEAAEKQMLAEKQAQEQAEQQRIAAQNYNDAVKAGDAYYQAGKYSEAATQYSIALKNVPEDKYASGKLSELNKIEQDAKDREARFHELVNNGSTLSAQGDYSKAMTCYEDALAIKPDNAELKGKISELEQIIKKKNPTGIKNVSEDDWNKE